MYTGYEQISKLSGPETKSGQALYSYNMTPEVGPIKKSDWFRSWSLKMLIVIDSSVKDPTRP